MDSKPDSLATKENMQTQGRQWRVVRFNTFETDRNQGFVAHLGDVEVYVDRASITATRKQSCTSYELVHEIADVVTVDGRSFLVQESTFRSDGDPKWEVTLPHGFVPSIIKNYKPRCPKCGHKV